jgi:hypothetical protein
MYLEYIIIQCNVKAIVYFKTTHTLHQLIMNCVFDALICIKYVKFMQ